MPNPLPESERRRFIERAIQMNVPQDRILADLAQLEGRAPLSAEFEPGSALGGRALLPGGGAAVTPEEQEAGREFYAETLPNFAVPFALSAAGAGVAGLPGAAAGSALGEVLLGTRIRSEEGLIRPNLESGTLPRAALSGGLTLATGGAANLATRGLGYLGGVKQKFITPVLRKGPLGVIKAIKKPVETAEETAVRGAAEATRKVISPYAGERLPAMTTAKDALASLDAELAFAGARPSRQLVIGKIDDIIAARTPPANPEEAAANAAIAELKDFVPEKFENATHLHDWLTRIRGPVKEQLGHPGAPLHKEDLIDLQAFVRQYRDRLLGGPEAAGPRAFAQASKQIGAAKTLRNLLVDSKGNLKSGAEGAWRRVMNEKNHVLRRTLEDFDKQTGSHYAQDAIDLAGRRGWNPDDAGHAIFVLSIIARVLSGAARGAAKTAAVVRPVIAPTTAGMIGLTREDNP